MKQTKTKKTKKNSPKGATVPVKYNGNLLDKYNNCIMYDYLVVNYEGTPNFNDLPKNVIVQKAEYGTKIMKQVATILIDDVKFCTMVYEPRNEKIGKYLVQIKLENHLFYTMHSSNIKQLLSEFAKAINISYKNLSRLDVAIDFENATDVFDNLIRGLNSQEFRLGGRPKDLDFRGQAIGVNARMKKGVISYNGLTIGKRSSTKYCRIYNKSLEMEEVKYKSYIADYWSFNGMENKDVWRMEYSFNSKFLKDYKIGLDEIFSDNAHLNILKTALNNHFTIRVNTGKSEVNKEKIVRLFSFDKINHCMTFLIEKVTQLPNTILKSIRVAKRQVKGLYRNYYSSNNESFKDAMMHIINTYDIGSWFEEKRSTYLLEFSRETIILNKL